MKKVLLSTAAIMALSAPAFAQQEESGVKLDLGGHFKGYGVYVDSDTDGNRETDIIRETEVHFSGETTLDNGLTVGAHIEADAANGDSFDIDESYAYFSGSWGRVNFGAEDGAAFLLQVAAPAADSNYDGVRQFVNPFADIDSLDYAQDQSDKADKLTYLTPVFSGFQAGLSWTPEVTTASRGTNGVNDDNGDQDVVDVAVRYEGAFDGFNMNAGAGYTDVEGESNWNVGLDFDIGAWGVGAAYTVEEVTSNDDTETMVVGADYTTGPFTLGASYLNQDAEATDTDTDRYTGGVVYSYGPGMTFRGSVSYVNEDAAGTDTDGTAVLLGTQINF